MHMLKHAGLAASGSQLLPLHLQKDCCLSQNAILPNLSPMTCIRLQAADCNRKTRWIYIIFMVHVEPLYRPKSQWAAVPTSPSAPAAPVSLSACPVYLPEQVLFAVHRVPESAEAVSNSKDVSCTSTMCVTAMYVRRTVVSKPTTGAGDDSGICGLLGVGFDLQCKSAVKWMQIKVSHKAEAWGVSACDFVCLDRVCYEADYGALGA